MYYTTLKRIREHFPCKLGWVKLLKYLNKTQPDNEPLSLKTILDSNGIEDAIWALRTIENCPEIRLFSVRCVREIQHLLTDKRSLYALDVAELHAIDLTSKEELCVAYRDAKAALNDAYALNDATYAAYTVAADSAYTTNLDADAYDYAIDTAYAAAYAAYATYVADAADVVAQREKQRQDFISIFCQ